ncbi:MAG: class I SAM-dependent methyltransferase [Magnetococcales bacterium]|nr:class I SAM-dependent methyltransferase [Magnetococcales bacterium]
MSDSWDDHADGWDGDERVVFYSEMAYKSLLQVIKPEGLKVLDFGCGTGLLSQKIANHAKEVVALDSSPKMVQVLKKKNLANVATVVGELSQELIDGNGLFHDKFDLIVASSVCGFLDDYGATAKLLKQLLVSGGMFVQWDWLSGEDDDSGLNQKRVQATLTKAGFNSISFSQPFSIPSANGDMAVFMALGTNS